MQVDEAQCLIEICLEAGVNIFDTADVYLQGLSEEILSKTSIPYPVEFRFVRWLNMHIDVFVAHRAKSGYVWA